MDAPIDALDKKLIDLLGGDARVSNRQIATELGVTEGTVRGRLKRLQKDKLIAFTTITNFALEDAQRLGIVRVRADLDRVQAIAREIAKLPMVNAVLITMSRFPILVFSVFDELESLHAMASGQISPLRGVHQVEISITVKTVKYNSRLVRIVD